MEQKHLLPFIVILVFCILLPVPVGAALLEVTVKGPVDTISPAKNTLTIENPLQYGCSYPATGLPVCSYIPINSSTLTGTVPDAAAFTVFNNGDPVIATSIGGPGETWITLAKLYGARPNEELVTDIVGDIRTIPAPFIGDYALDTSAAPDCSVCSGTTCSAASATVKVMSKGIGVLERTLLPGESLSYNGRNDGSSIYVRFVKGQALSTACPGMASVTGSQAVSVYIIKVVPPVSSAQTNIRTATTTRPDEALTPFPPTILTNTQIPIPTTPRAGILPLAGIGAIGLAGIVLAKKRR
jgi:hypothetical protein